MSFIFEKKYRIPGKLKNGKTKFNNFLTKVLMFIATRSA